MRRTASPLWARRVRGPGRPRGRPGPLFCSASCRRGDLQLRGHLYVVEPGGVEAEDLLLALGRETGEVVVLVPFGVVPINEHRGLPLRVPDRVIAGPQHLVLANPEQQLAHDRREEARAAVHQPAKCDGEASVHIRLLRRHKAEVFYARQPDVLDDKLELREVRRGDIYVADVEGVLGERPDRRSLVDVDVGDAELHALLEVRFCLRIGERPALRVSPPFRRIELDALAAVAVDLLLEFLEALATLAGIEGGVQDELVWVLLRQRRVLLGGVETVLVPLLEVGGEEDRLVYVPVLEEVLHHSLFRVLLELLHRPVVLFRTELVVAVEALDPTLRVLLLALDPVLWRCIPEVDVPIHHEILLAVFLVQSALLLFPLHDTLASGSRTYRP